MKGLLALYLAKHIKPIPQVTQVTQVSQVSQGYYTDPLDKFRPTNIETVQLAMCIEDMLNRS